MVHVTSGEVSDARVRLASEIAVHFEAKLVGISACVYPVEIFTSGPISGDELKYETQKLISELKCRKTHFLQIAGEKNAHNGWRSATEFPIQSVLHELRCSDLLIIGKDKEKSKIDQPLDPITVILRAGRPILMVPSHVKDLSFKKIIIGWKDTREARRVVLDAVQYLRRAKRVLVTSVCEKNQTEMEIKSQLWDVLDYLAGHGIAAELKVITSPKLSIGDEIIQFTKEENADLIVAGAYGRSQIGEWIFGGVTETLVAETPVSCFFSH
jgi:nucleotide-binding universal stress UspA family protein